MAVTKRKNTKLSSSTATPAPNASSIWIELVAAVKVFEIEERREIAAGHVRPMPLRGRGRLRFFYIVDIVELDGGDRLALGRSRHSLPAWKMKIKA